MAYTVSRKAIRPATLLAVAAVVLSSGLGTGVVSAQGPSPDPLIDIRDTVKKTFSVEPGGTLEIEADRGDVTIRTIRGHEVRMAVERIVSVNREEEAKSILQSHRLEMAKKGEVVLLSSRIDARRFNWRNWKGDNRLKVNMIIDVPEEYNVAISTGAGNVSVSDLEGELLVRSGAGNIAFDNIVGRVEVNSGSGNVASGDITGSVEINTGAGNIVLTSVRGALQVATGAGDIRAHFTDQPEVGSELSSGAGNITVYVADNVGMNVDASAFGNCSTDFPLRVEGSWMTKTIEGELNGGGPPLAIRASVGNIQLRKVR